MIAKRGIRTDESPGWGQATLVSAGIGSVAGALAALVWGGVGGRIVMRVLFLTSDDSVRGVESDSGFEIGTFSLETVFLFVFVAIIGAIIGLFGGLLRMSTVGPTWLVASGVGLSNAAFFGALLVTPDGLDFRVLEPVWLAIALFVALPGFWGATVVALAEWLARPGVVFTNLPQRINDRHFGLVGWGVLSVMTIVGIVSLVSDARALM
jgi:hypothetical protein